MTTIHLEMPDGVFSSLRKAPDEFAFELRFAAATQWYHYGLMSGSKAAQVAGMTRLEFLDELARRRLDVIAVDMEDLKREIDGD